MTVLVCFDHDSLMGMWTSRNLTLNPLYYSPIDVNGGLFGHPFPVVHDQLLCLAHVRKSRIQLQREMCSPRVLSLVMSFVGTMVLNAEL